MKNLPAKASLPSVLAGDLESSKRSSGSNSASRTPSAVGGQPQQLRPSLRKERKVSSDADRPSLTFSEHVRVHHIHPQKRHRLFDTEKTKVSRPRLKPTTPSTFPPTATPVVPSVDRIPLVAELVLVAGSAELPMQSIAR